ncbi:MAG: glycine zipper family protein [Polyangiaceae bacterium]|nr:glycine zipper family protein [Polyangiaceae bacterium]
MQTSIGNEQSFTPAARARRTIASYSSYGSAQRAVDMLADRKFPVERVAIVAEGLKIVEQVTGRLTYGRVALNGALSGAVIGGFFGLMLGLFNWIAPLIGAFEVALYGVLYGGVVGALMSVIFYALTGGRRDFSSASGVAAERYNIVADEEVADEASRLIRSVLGAPPSGSAIPQPA